MDSETSTPSPDALDTKPSFPKPPNDAANRKYRRHSSAGMSDSSSSDGSAKRERDRSPVFSKECRSKMDGGKRKDEEGNSNKYESYPNHRRHDDHNRHQRDAVEDERNYRRPARSSQDSRGGNHFEHSRRESGYTRPGENNRSVDKYARDKSDIDRYSRDKYDSRTYRNREPVEYHRHSDRHSDRAVSGGRYENSYKDDIKSREDRYRDRGNRDEKRERRSPGDRKNDHATSHEGVKGHPKDSRLGRDNSAVHRKEIYLSSSKEMDKDNMEHRRRHDDRDYMEHKRKHDDSDYDKLKDRYARGQEEEIQIETKGSSILHDTDGKNEQNKDKITHAAEDPSSKKLKSGHLEKPAAEDGVNSRQVKENDANVSSEDVSSSNSQAEATQDFNAAKVAAMKAAELVNRNLVGSGFLSTDQKKKLLWGSKKNTSAEESGNRWDMPLFTDRERQEKFNKLMSLRLPWYLWPTVGGEGRCQGGAQTRRQGWQPPSGEAEGTPDRFGEAVHCWTSEARRQNGRSWPVINNHHFRWYTLSTLSVDPNFFLVILVLVVVEEASVASQ